MTFGTLRRLVIFSAYLIFSFWLMNFTFSSSRQDSVIHIAGRLQSDFSAHLPLIRSFSFGGNFPAGHPLFGGEPYHFYYGFYALVGILERLGFPLGWAMNIPSIASFFLFLVFIYLVAAKLFRSELVGFFSVVFFLFNSSLSFLEFFKAHPLSTNTFRDVVGSTDFSSFGPWDGKLVSAFWNLNIYTNQRHLAFAFLAVLILFYLLLQEKIKTWQIILVHFVLLVLPFFHLVGFLVCLVVLFMSFFIFGERRGRVVIFSLILPFSFLVYFYFVRSPIGSPVQVNPRYLIEGPLTFFVFVRYWFYNLGFSLITIPLGFLLSSWKQKRVLMTLLPVVLIGHTLQFSPEMAANHKFFNIFMIVGNMYTAYLVVRMFFATVSRWILLPKLIFLIVLIFFLTLSGILDFFPVVNDSVGTIDDYPRNPTINWIVNHTPKRSVFLNNTFMFNPASLAGRPIFMGWPYFPWSGGYDSNTRRDLMGYLLSFSGDSDVFCRTVVKQEINYAILSTSFQDFPTDYDFYANKLTEVYKNEAASFKIYDLKGCYGT